MSAKQDMQDAIDLTKAEIRKAFSGYKPTHRHYKGGLYQLLGQAKHTETEEELTIYRDSDGNYWARPRAMFDEPGRFTPLASAQLSSEERSDTTDTLVDPPA
jgi:hypothetical protein